MQSAKARQLDFFGMRIRESKNGDVIDVTFPRYFFKYMPINGNTLSSISEDYLWFSGINDFNDPFECSRSYKSNISDEDLIRWFLASETQGQIVRSMMGKGMSIEEIGLEFVAMLIANKKRLLEDYFSELHRGLASLSGISCLSEVGDNPLMWAHYGNNLSGMCLLFDTTRLLQTNNYALHKVRYLKRIPKYDYIKYSLGARTDPKLRASKKRNHDHHTEMHAVKTAHWSYEREQRLVSDKKGKVPLPDGSLVGIILGPSTSSYDAMRVALAALNDRKRKRLLYAWTDEKSQSFRLHGAGRTFKFLSDAMVISENPTLLERERSISPKAMIDLFSSVDDFGELRERTDALKRAMEESM